MAFDEIAQRYMDVYHDCTKEQIMTLLNKYPGRVISNEHMVILFVRIDEQTLHTINYNPHIVADHNFIMDCYSQRGGHIYLLKGFGCAKGYRDLIKRLTRYWAPLSISYHIDKDNFSRAHVLYERKDICHS
jgi:hypothetical protein